MIAATLTQFFLLPVPIQAPKLSGRAESAALSSWLSRWRYGSQFRDRFDRVRPVQKSQGNTASVLLYKIKRSPCLQIQVADRTDALTIPTGL